MVYWDDQLLLDDFLKGCKPVGNSLKGRRILFATSIISNNSVATIDAALAAVCKMNGATIAQIACSAPNPVCQKFKFKSFEAAAVDKKRHSVCSRCLDHNSYELFDRVYPLYDGNKSQEGLGYEDNDNDDEASIDEIVRSTLIRMSAKVDWEPVFRPLFEPAKQRCREIIQNLEKINEDFAPDIVVAHHGIYFPQGLIANYFKSRSMLLTYWLSYKQGCVVFGFGDTYHRHIPDQTGPFPTLTTVQRADTLDYIEKKEAGSGQWINFHDRVDRSVKIVGDFDLVCTNVSWDASIHFEAKLFPDMETWLDCIIETYQKNRKQLVIRVHPAELSGYVKSRYPVSEHLSAKFGQMTDNIKVVDADDPDSTWELIKRCRRLFIYGSKVGIDAAAIGKKVIVAGDAWCRNKGFTIEPDSIEMFENEMNEGEGGDLSGHEQDLAIRFAHDFYFRQHVRVPAILKRSSKEYGFDINALPELLNDKQLLELFGQH